MTPPCNLRRLTIGAAAGALLFAAACDDAPFVGTISRSQYWEYHDQIDEPLCPTLLSLLDAHAQIFAPKIDVRLDPGNPFRYFKFRDQDAFAAANGGGAEGVTFDSGVQSPAYFSPHEQAHAYFGRASGRWSTQLLDEGAAVAMSCAPITEPDQNTTPRQLLGPVDWRPEVDDFSNTPTAYAAAGFFVAQLAQQYGWDQVARLHRSVPPGVSAIDFERIFARVFPVSMDDAWSQMLDTAGATGCDKSWLCRATPLAVGDSAQPECDDLLHRSITVDAGAAGVGLDLADGRAITLSGRCADAAARWYPLPFYAAGWPATHWAFVPPGSYTLFAGATTTPMFPGQHGTVTDGEFRDDEAVPRDVGLRALIPASTLAGTGACGSPALVLTPKAITMIDLFHGFDDVWIPIDGGGDSYRVVEVNMNDAFGASPPLAVCDGCGPAATCTALPIASITIGAGGFLHVQDVAVDRLPMAGQIIFDPFDAAAP